MRKQKGFLFLALIGVAALLMASCGQNGGPADSPANPGSGQEPEPSAVKAIDKGTVIQKEGNRLLITAYVEKNGAPYIDAYWFTVNEQTVFQDSGGKNVPRENISVGTQVQAWHTGAVEESYPAQTGAAKIILYKDTEQVPEGMIDRTKAVQSALQSQTGSTAAWAVKNALLDAENGYWNVELVKHEAADQPITVQIDARSGQPVPAPVAENEVFRVHSPKPGTEAGPSFTVEGEARVFEAAFSWKLEDGHTILAEGHEMADGGAPEWGNFRFNISYDKASQADITLILFVYSAKDGSVEHELIVPLKAPEKLIDYTVE